MRRLLVTSCLALTVIIGSTSRTEAAPIYQYVDVDFEQLSVERADSANPGFTIVTTTWQITNNTGSDLTDLMFWYSGALLNTERDGSGIAEVTTWDGASQTYRVSFGTMTAVNNTGYLPVGLSDLVFPNELGIDADESLPVWAIADLSTGESLTLVVQRETSPDVRRVNSAPYAVTTTVPTPVPEPTTLTLLGAGTVALALQRRRATRRP